MNYPGRAVAIVIKDHDVLLMERKNNGKHYFVFPGGGIEERETVEEAVLREIEEETTVSVKIQKKLYTHYYDSPHKGRSNQYFYLCSYLSGEPKLGEANEKEDMKKGNDYYNPQWFPISDLRNMLVYPLEIRDWLLEDIKNNFINTPKEAHLKVEELRKNL